MWTDFNKKLEELKEKFQFKPSATIKCLECGKMLDENETELFWKITPKGTKEEGKSLSSCSSCKSKNLEMIVKWTDIEYRCSIDECSKCGLSKVDIINWEELVEKKQEKTWNFPVKVSKEYAIKELMKNISEVCECEVIENLTNNIEANNK